MRSLWRRDWIPALWILAILLGILQLINYQRVIGQPFGGFMADRFIIDNYWYVGSSTPPWWEGISQGRLQAGDKLLALEGRPYGQDHGQRFAQAGQSDRETVTLTVERDGHILEREIPLVSFRLSHFLDLKLPGFINGLGFLLLAVVVYTTRPDHSVNRLFAVSCMLVGVNRWLIQPGLFLDRSVLTKMLDLLNAMSAPFAAAFVIHLGLLFPSRSRALRPMTLGLVYGFASILSLSFAISRGIWWGEGWTPLGSWVDRLCYQGALALLGFSVLFVIGRYVWVRHRSVPGTRLHRQATIVLAGYVLTTPYIALLIIEGTLVGTTFYQAGLNLRFLLLAVPLAFAYVILRYQTFQSRHPALLGVLVFAGSALAASIADWLVRLSLVSPSTQFVVPPFVPVFMTILFTGLYWTTQSSWRGLYGRLLHRRARSYRAARRFAERLITRIDDAALPERLALALVEEMRLVQAGIWLRDEDGSLVLAGRAGTWTSAPPERLLFDDGDLLSLPHPVRLQAVPPTPSWLMPLVQQGDLQVVAPLYVTELPLGLLALGRRWDEEIFDNQDLEIVVLVAQQAALFVLAAQQIDALRKVPQRVAEAQERERERIARELHDTIQQFLGRLPFYLEISRQSLGSDPQEAEEILTRSIADVESAAQTVRQIQQNLAPGQLEIGLKAPLEEMVNRFAARTGLQVNVHIDQDVDDVLTLASRHALYRVVQQALDNVSSHAKATRVTVHIERQQEGIHFAIKDDGCGCSAAQRRAAQARGSFGLQSMAARVRTQGGQFQLHSAPGEGMLVSGSLPQEQDD